MLRVEHSLTITMPAMSNHHSADKPDFLVRWHDQSSRNTEQFFWHLEHDDPDSKLREGAFSLHTDTTHVEVSHIDWDQPTTLTFSPNLIGLTLLVSSTASIDYDYGQGKGKSVKAGESGKLLFMLPGKDLRATMTAGKIHTVTCSFERSFAEQIIGPITELSAAKLHNALDMRSSLISAMLLRLMHEAIAPGEISDDIVKSLGQAMLVECHHWLLVGEEAEITKQQLSASDLEIIEQQIAGSTGTFPGVADLAAACGFSERYFARLFRQHFGSSVSEHLKAARMSKAKSLLLETQLPLKEIAYRLGYSSSANFSSAFRAAIGSTPGQYRKSS